MLSAQPFVPHKSVAVADTLANLLAIISDPKATAKLLADLSQAVTEAKAAQQSAAESLGVLMQGISEYNTEKASLERDEADHEEFVKTRLNDLEARTQALANERAVHAKNVGALAAQGAALAKAQREHASKVAEVERVRNALKA
jgi:hypothetical protein